MPFPLADLVAVPSLGLPILAGADALDHPVQWAHVSELLDPTPVPEGGELLLTGVLGRVLGGSTGLLRPVRARGRSRRTLLGVPREPVRTG